MIEKERGGLKVKILFLFVKRKEEEGREQTDFIHKDGKSAGHSTQGYPRRVITVMVPVCHI